MTWYQEWFGEEYLDLYSYRDDDEARRHISFFQSQFGHIDGIILDLACGSGRHLNEFFRSGYDARGCDLSYPLLRKAFREHPESGVVVRADMRHLPFGSSRFHGLTNFFTSFGYFENEDDNFAAAREMARVLRDGAPFLLDYLNVKRELQKLVQSETLVMDQKEVGIERWFDASSKTFNKRITIGDRRFLERVRGYYSDELGDLFVAAGFTIRKSFGDFDGGDFDDESPRLILVGEKTR